MGGVMIKLGQFISTRADILPEEITNELAGLQDEVPSVPNEKMRAVIEGELGPVASRFRWIAETPVAAASLGQVYRAQLLNGDRVVVKVQRPGIREVVQTDLTALRIVSHIANRFTFIRRRADMVALTDEFGRVLLEELSYQHEAYNAARFHALFADNPHVYVPVVYGEYSSDRVLTMEDVTSIKITDFAAMEAAGINRRAVADRRLEGVGRRPGPDRGPGLARRHLEGRRRGPRGDPHVHPGGRPPGDQRPVHPLDPGQGGHLRDDADHPRRPDRPAPVVALR